jgi:ribonuclease HI
MAKKAFKFYVIWVGSTTGVFEKKWDEIKEYVTGFPKAKFKGFNNRLLADQAFENGLPPEDN